MGAKGTINYKRMVKAVIVCSVTEKFFESGVETSVHVGSPVKAEISMSSGQVHVSMKNPEEPRYNRKQTIVEVDVLPYTHSGPIAKKAMEVEGKKPIKSPKEEKKTTLPLGKPFDLDVSLMTEEEDFEITRVLKDLKASALSELAGSPVPSHASRRTSFRVTMNPRDSECKEADLYLTIGASSKRSKKMNQEFILSRNLRLLNLKRS